MVDGGTIGPLIEELGIPVYSLHMRRSGTPSLQNIINFKKIVKKIQPHLIQGWMYHGNLAASCASFICGRPPVIWNIRQSLLSFSNEKKSTALIIKLGGLMAKLPEAIIFNAVESSRQHIKIGYPAAKSIVIPNGFDTDLFSPDPYAAALFRSELNLPENTKIIGMIARYHPMKDYKNFLHAASLVCKQNNDVRFVIAGKDIDGNNSKLQNMIHSFGLDDKVSLLGERNDAPRIFAGLDIAVLSSAWGEAFPNVLGEAMSCEVPCVATDIGDSARVIGDTGVIVPARNSNDLAEGLFSLVNMSDEQRRDLGCRARQRIIDNFSIASIVNQYELLYHRIDISR
jgi:glycosyltransferase involved in cell wall biosynthesis